MTHIDEFRSAALALPNCQEQDHFERPSFRVGSRIFATLWADERRVVLKFTPEDQRIFMEMAPEAFLPVGGNWGEKGWTSVLLERVQPEHMHDALETAWAKVAPKKLVKLRQERTEEPD